MAKAKFELTPEKALERLNSNKQVTIASDAGEVIKNVRVGNISYLNGDGNPFTFGEGGEPKVLVNLMLIDDYGVEQATEHIANGDFGLATNQNMVASVSPEIADQLDPYMSEVNVLVDTYTNSDGITCLGVDRIAIPRAQKVTKKADFTSVFAGLIENTVTETA